MPLNGSDQASKPAGTSAVPNTTIESDKYNSVVNDIYQILNTVRTVAKGFTGASTAIGAQDNLNTVSTDIASGSAIDLSDATGIVVNITGTTTIASLGTVSAGGYRVLVFGGALTLTHGTSLKLPGDDDLTVAEGDVAIFRSEGSGTWHLESFLPKEGYLKPSDIGTTAGTVAAGDDSRITGATQADDLASTTASKGASLVGVEAIANVTGATVQAVLKTLAGVGQKWQDVTSSRALGTSYQNTSGAPIWVAARTSGAGIDAWEVSEDGSAWVWVGLVTGNGADQSAFFRVPPGHYYRANVSASRTLSKWSELR